jgi:hypothetical protein
MSLLLGVIAISARAKIPRSHGFTPKLEHDDVNITMEIMAIVFII